MKMFKRNAVIITVLLFVCVAVYLNWSYDQKSQEASQLPNDINPAVNTGVQDDEPSDDIDSETEKLEPSGLYYSPEGDDSAANALSEYFSEVRLDRSRARDEASATLQTIATSEGASQETIDSALQKMTRIADWTVKEVELENLINAKGFIDCVVYISENGVSVTVAAEEGLSSVSAAKITDIIVTETEFTANELKIIEIK